MRQHRADHGADQQARGDGLKPRNPEQDGTANLDQPGDIAEPLAQPDFVKCADHHLDTHQFRGASGQKGQGQQPPDYQKNCVAGLFVHFILII